MLTEERPVAWVEAGWTEDRAPTEAPPATEPRCGACGHRKHQGVYCGTVEGAFRGDFCTCAGEAQ